MNIWRLMAFRRTLLTIAAAVALVSFVGIGSVWSYVRTAKNTICETIRDAVGIEFDLKRLETMIDGLVPEIRTNQKVAAQLEVEIEYLEVAIGAMRESQAEERQKMDKMRKGLDEQEDKLTFGNQSFARAEVEQDLQRRLAAYDDLASQLDAKEKILSTRRQTLLVATDKIRQYEHQRRMLEQKSESLKSELKLVELAEVTGTFSFDNSKLAQTKQLAQDVEKRIRTVQKLVDGERHFQGEIPVELDARPVTERYDEYFAQKP